MSVNDLVFEVVATSETIYDPLVLTTTSSVSVRVTNYGVEDLSGLGLYVVPSTSLGDVDNPADFPPHTDFQDLLTWGEAVVAGVESVGGLKVSLPQNTGPNVVSYIARSQGSKKANKLTFKDLLSGANAVFTLTLETPPAVVSRRLFIDLVIE